MRINVTCILNMSSLIFGSSHIICVIKCFSTFMLSRVFFLGGGVPY